jgi:sulfonate transport system ATP-binding protein
VSAAALDLLERPRPPLAHRLPAVPPDVEEPGLTVELAGLGKSFGARKVLEGIDLVVPAGRFVAVVGRSGCGKSTLLRLLAGLETPSEGEILLDALPTVGLPPRVRLLFQDARLLPWQRVIDNVGIAAREPGWRQHAREALADVGLADRARDWPAVLSGGQRQRVALARALVSRPRLLLLDEPFGALDALTRMEMHELLTRIWGRDRFTTVLITHDVVEAVTLADHVLVLKDGGVALDEPVEVPRPRRPDDPRLLALQRRVLAAV